MKIKSFEEWLNESPEHKSGNAPFEDDEIKDRISDISQRIIELDYILLKENLIKGLSLYKHKTLPYFIVGTWYFDNDEKNQKYDKPRFAVITDLSCNIDDKFRSEQKQLMNKKMVKISTIHTTRNWRGNGISTALYKYIVENRYAIISDSIQYDGAVNLWKKFPKVSNSVIGIYDIIEDKIISKFTDNTPYKHVWSTDSSKQRIRLIFTKL